jgi:hypothetical protein
MPSKPSPEAPPPKQALPTPSLARLRSLPIQRCPIHPEGAGNVYNSVTGVQPLDRLAALMRG